MKGRTSLYIYTPEIHTSFTALSEHDLVFLVQISTDFGVHFQVLEDEFVKTAVKLRGSQRTKFYNNLDESKSKVGILKDKTENFTDISEGL